MSVASGPPPRPRRDQERNRRSLVTAAVEVFAEQGLDAPLDAIGKRAGLGNATLYRHFPRRQDLIVEVLLIELARNERVLADALERESGWDGFVTYLAWLFTEQIENLAYMSALRAVSAGQNTDVDRMRDQTLAQLQELIGRAKTEGRFRADRWIEDVYLLLALNEQLAHSGHTGPASASQRFLELALTSLANDPAVDGESPPPPTVLALRRTLGHELAGLAPDLA
jgi:AcrR family transcriptional regulator